jgi:hypothetical protein
MAKGKKTGGREIGTPNKITNEVREIVKTILSSELKNLQTYISQIEKPETKARLLIDLLPYVTPKYQNIGFESANDNNENKNLPPFMRAKNLPEWLNEE